MHGGEGFLHVAGDAEGQARHHRAGGEGLGIGGQQHRGHGAPGRQAGDENPSGVEPMGAHHAPHHRVDGGCLAGAPGDVAGLEPVEAAVRIVGAVLLGRQDGEAQALGQRHPSRRAGVGAGALGAAVQDHDQGGVGREVFGNIGQHPEAAGIEAEAAHLGEAAVLPARRRALHRCPHIKSDHTAIT